MYVSHDISLEIDKARRLLRLTVTGRVTDPVILECSRIVRATPEFQSGYSTLLDLSNITKAEVSSQVVVGIAQSAQEDTNRIAILTQNITAFGMARMYEIVADLSEQRVQVHTDEELALEWLTG